MAQHNLVRLIISLGTCLLAGYFNSLYAIPLLPSYFAPLKKPWLFLPDSLFVPVGWVVYLLLGLTLFFIWTSDTTEHHEKQVCSALFLFGLILNVTWVYTFFGLQSPFMGLLTMVCLFAVLMATMYQTVRVSFGATLLLLPYVLITFAVAYTNYRIVVLNPAIPLLPF
jgi:tryptophan-rich sensory protein